MSKNWILNDGRTEKCNTFHDSHKKNHKYMYFIPNKFCQYPWIGSEEEWTDDDTSTQVY